MYVLIKCNPISLSTVQFVQETSVHIHVLNSLLSATGENLDGLSLSANRADHPTISPPPTVKQKA